MTDASLPMPLLDGRPLAQSLASFERAIAYGDGLFETLLVIDGVVPLWHLHLARLQHSARRLALSLELDAIEQSVQRMSAGGFSGLLKLTVARCGGPRGYDWRAATGTTVLLTAYALPRYSSQWRDEGVALQLCRQRLSHNPTLAGLKHLNRLEQVLAAGECNRALAAEGLLLDVSGHVVEATFSNVFIVREGKLQTPRLDQCGVAGVMRAHLMHMADGMGLPVREMRLTTDDLLAADECFVCNSVFGIWPVLRIGVASIAGAAMTGAGHGPGAVTRALQMQLSSLGYDSLYR